MINLKTLKDKFYDKYNMSESSIHVKNELFQYIDKFFNLFNNNRELSKCTEESLINSFDFIVKTGLYPNDTNGYLFIYPQGNKQGKLEAVCILGYKGMIELLYRNTKVKSVKLGVVYEGDYFEYQYGTEEFLKHKPSDDKKKNILTHTYAIIKYGDETIFTVVDKKEIEEVEKNSIIASMVRKEGLDIFNFMQSKIALKKLTKTLPYFDGNESLKFAVSDEDSIEKNFKKNKEVVITETNNEEIKISVSPAMKKKSTKAKKNEKPR